MNHYPSHKTPLHGAPRVVDAVVVGNRELSGKNTAVQKAEDGFGNMEKNSRLAEMN